MSLETCALSHFKASVIAKKMLVMKSDLHIPNISREMWLHLDADV